MTLSKKTKQNLGTYGVIFVLLIGFISYYADFNPSQEGEDAAQKIRGNGLDYFNAVDGDPKTYWGKHVSKNLPGHVTFQYPEMVLLEEVSILAGAPRSSAISYIFTIRVSNDGVHWTELVPRDVTEPFKGDELFEYDFVPTRTKYVDVVAQVQFFTAPFKIYEVEVKTKPI